MKIEDRIKKKTETKQNEVEADDLVLSVYTRYPSKDKFQPQPGKIPTVEELNKIPAHIREMDLTVQVSMPLLIRHSLFKTTKNPVLALEAFLIAHRAGLYPPKWVLNYMAGIFEEFSTALTSTSTKSLDRLFGFKPKQGQSVPLKTLLNEQRDEILCRDVYLLNKLFGIAIEKASEMVARRLEENNYTEMKGPTLKKITADTVKDRYLKKWTKIFNDPLLRMDELNWSKEQQKDFLKQFPEDSYEYLGNLNR